MDRLFVRVGALAGFIGVAFGAFGAHALRARLSADHLATFETGVRYQLVHALALLAVGVLIERRPTRLAVAAGWCFIGGIALFSGSLYLLSVNGAAAAGFVTPFGGLLFLAGWTCLALSAH